MPKYFLKGSDDTAYRRRRTGATYSAIALRRQARYQAARSAQRKSTTGSAIAMVNKRTGGFEDMENKFLTSEITNTNLTAAWATYNPTGTGCTNSISVPAQGDGESQRDGRVYYINSVHVNGQCYIPPSESQLDPGIVGTLTHVRIILYWDTQTNGAQATATDIMDSSGSVDYLAFRNLQNSKRFIVLKDKRVAIRPFFVNEGSANLFATAQNSVVWRMNKKFKKPIKVRCTGTTANVSSISDSNIGVIAIADSVASSPVIRYQARIRFSG